MSTRSGVRFVGWVTSRFQALAILAGLLLLPLAARANTITVNSTADTTSTRFCILRDAITAANTNLATGGCAAGSGDDTIEFDLVLPATIKLTSNVELLITSNVTIDGPGASSLTIDGNKKTRVFHITAGTTNMSGLSIKHGIAAPADPGGGIYNDGATLTLTNCTLSGNTAGTYGGGIYSTDVATLTNCTLSGNTAGTSGGGIDQYDATLTLTNCTLSGNTAGASGGGIYSGGGATLTLTNGTLSGNKAGTSGGGIYSGSGGILVLTDCRLSGNTASASMPVGAGGGVYSESAGALTRCTLSGNTAPASDGGGIFFSAGIGGLNLTDCTLSGNKAGTYGGGISDNGGAAHLTNCTLSGNKAGTYGGGISDNGGSVLTLTKCTLSGNKAGTYGGGISDNGGSMLTLTKCTLSGNTAGSNSSAGSGGGFYSNGVADLTGCTLSANKALGPGALGGGIFINTNTTTLTNCTLSSNTAGNGATGGSGGGIYNVATASLTNCTLSGNSTLGGSAGGSANGIFNEASSTASFANTIIADRENVGASPTGDCGNPFGGTVIDNGHNLNLTSDPLSNCGLTGVTDIVGSDPKLKGLANNGGATKTMALATGSPAIDAGDNAQCPAVDQRGLLRITGTDPTCDIGAYEAP